MGKIRGCWAVTGTATAEPPWDVVGDTSVWSSWSAVGGVPTGPSRREIGDVLPGSSCSSTRIVGAIRRPKRARISIRELIESVVTSGELGLMHLLFFTYHGSLLIHLFLAEVSRRGVVRGGSRSGGPRVSTGPLRSVSLHNRNTIATERTYCVDIRRPGEEWDAG